MSDQTDQTGLAVHFQRSATRCPYCHDTAAPSLTDVVVCADCLARHHRECWREVSCCGSCAGGEALGRVLVAQDESRGELSNLQVFVDVAPKVVGALAASWLCLLFLVRLVMVSRSPDYVPNWEAFFGSMSNIALASLLFTAFVMGRAGIRWMRKRRRELPKRKAREQAHVRRLGELFEEQAERHPEFEAEWRLLAAGLRSSPSRPSNKGPKASTDSGDKGDVSDAKPLQRALRA